MGSGFRTFQSGEVLTSSNVQNYLMDQAVTVFAGTAARGSAIASPETGMVSYRTDGTADSKREGFEFYDGASWTRLIPAASSGALVLVKSQTIGSAVSSVAVTNAFSATYDNYKIMISGGASSANSWLGLQLGATTTGYYWGRAGASYASGSDSNDQLANGASFTDIAYTGTTGGLAFNCELINPYLAKKTGIGWFNMMLVSGQAGGAGAGFLDNTTSYTDFTITVHTGTITGGEIRVYGYAMS